MEDFVLANHLQRRQSEEVTRYHTAQYIVMVFSAEHHFFAVKDTHLLLMSKRHELELVLRYLFFFSTHRVRFDSCFGVLGTNCKQIANKQWLQHQAKTIYAAIIKTTFVSLLKRLESNHQSSEALDREEVVNHFKPFLSLYTMAEQPPEPLVTIDQHTRFRFPGMNGRAGLLSKEVFCYFALSLLSKCDISSTTRRSCVFGTVTKELNLSMRIQNSRNVMTAMESFWLWTSPATRLLRWL